MFNFPFPLSMWLLLFHPLLIFCSVSLRSLFLCFLSRSVDFVVCSHLSRGVNKDLTPKDQDKDLTPKDKDKDKDLLDLTPKDKDKDLIPKDQDKDKDLKYVLKESLRTRTRTRTTARQIILIA